LPLLLSHAETLAHCGGIGFCASHLPAAPYGIALGNGTVLQFSAASETGCEPVRNLHEPVCSVINSRIFIIDFHGIIYRQVGQCNGYAGNLTAIYRTFF
jgi:hypothetical protein